MFIEIAVEVRFDGGPPAVAHSFSIRSRVRYLGPDLTGKAAGRERRLALFPQLLSPPAVPQVASWRSDQGHAA